MDLHHSDSDCSDDSWASDHSIDHPPSFSRDLNLELKINIEELKSEVNRNPQTLIGQIKELDDAIDELESVHKNTTVGSLVGASVGAVGGIAAIAGLCLAPFTLGASLALTVGGAVAVAGGVTTGASNITNMVKQKTLRENIKKIINDLLNRIKPMVKHLDNIYNITEGIQLQKTSNKLDIQRAGRGAVDVLKIAGVADLAEIGQVCAEAAKDIRVYVKTVKAVRGSAETAKYIRMAAVFTGAVSVGLLALDVYYIVQDSKELSEMNQPADKRKEEDISSETLKYILQIKAAADQFKKIVKTIKDVKDTIDTKFCETTLPLKPGKDTEKVLNKGIKVGNNAYYFKIM